MSDDDEREPARRRRGVKASELSRQLAENPDLAAEETGPADNSSFREEWSAANARQQRESEQTSREIAMFAGETVHREERATSATIEVPERLQALERAAEAEAERLEQRHRQVVRLMRWTLFASALAVLVSIGALLVPWLLGGSP